MKAVILAAGIGKRLRPLTKYIPKILLPIHGKPLLWYHFNILHKNNISDITLVLGREGTCWNSDSYKAIERICKEFSNKRLRIKIKINNKNLKTDSCYSFKIATEEISDGNVLVLDGDVIYSHSLLNKLLNYGFNVNRTVMLIKPLITKYERGGKVLINNIHQVLTTGKFIKTKDIEKIYVYSGILFLKNDDYNLIRTILNENKKFHKYNLIVLLRYLCKKYRNIYALIDDGWININTMKNFVKAHEVMQPLEE